jgi:type I restriction enzyme M protein
MVAVGNNFFYTRSLPCTLWFFDRGKESLNFDSSDLYDSTDSTNQIQKRSKDNVLMLDARKIYRKVTSKVNDFSPEQLQNLICIVNLYRGNTKKMEDTVSMYLQTAADCARQTADATAQLQKVIQTIISNQKIKGINGDLCQSINSLDDITEVLAKQNELIETVSQLNEEPGLIALVASQAKGLRKPQDKLIKQLLDFISTAVKELQLNKNKDWKELNLKEQLDQLKDLQLQLCGNPSEDEPGLLHETEYYWKQAHRLQSRFPEGKYTDVEGLCKVVTQTEIEAKDWSLSPGRYVGVDTATDEDFDYEARLQEIHIELEGLNEEAIALANSISENFKELVL